MSPERERLIRESWAALQPHHGAVSSRFYTYLFAADPRVEEMFRGSDMERQRAKLVAMLADVVAVSDDPDALVPRAAELGRVHGDFALTSRDYELVGAALLSAMEDELGATFTPEMKDGWRELYRTLAAIMQRVAVAERLRAMGPSAAAGLAGSAEGSEA